MVIKKGRDKRGQKEKKCREASKIQKGTEVIKEEERRLDQDICTAIRTMQCGREERVGKMAWGGGGDFKLGNGKN